ncbi:hypothetical protein DYE50_00530 [Treponema ruminis]|uniref:Uncharacterized protein n=1 Tax=Treponema ruminis TaxID=744515 RepID=A0A7W8G7B5_9SPIR|nr:hypothetical protein [Treponema ruminis]MBB5225146.1 hypothetical protein [Treponema ruminis]QSI01067.1 hypothetical protein DYE50_00530 [Treponema ruminis]
MKYRRKETVEALQWNGRNQAELKAFAGQFVMFDYADVDKDGVLDALLKVKNAEKIEKAEPGDYIVRGKKGDFFIMKQAEFEALYEEAE